MIPLTTFEAEVLAHTSNTGRYVTDDARVIEMADRGLLKDYGPQNLAGGMHYFTMTSAGRKALSDWRATQPVKAPVKVTRSRQRYLDYIEVADCFDGFLSYLNYLTRKRREGLS